MFQTRLVRGILPRPGTSTAYEASRACWKDSSALRYHRLGYHPCNTVVPAKDRANSSEAGFDIHLVKRAEVDDLLSLLSTGKAKSHAA